MTVRDLFVLIIKLFGLYALINNLFSTLSLSINFWTFDSGLKGYLMFGAGVLLTICFFVGLLFYSNKLVDLLKLPKGFDQNLIDLSKVDAVFIVRIGCFVIGGLLIIDNTPVFINQLLVEFQADIINVNTGFQNKFNWVLSAVNILLGYLMIDSKVAT